MLPKKIYKGGRFINEEDQRNNRKVCVIGERTQEELFEEDENPLGKYIRINNVYFQVIGVHKYLKEEVLKPMVIFLSLLIRSGIYTIPV